MVDITVTISNVDKNKVGDIISTCKSLDEEATINITSPWPLLEFGDTFTYNGEEFGFLSYVGNGTDKKVRCISKETMVSSDTYLQVVYFDCTKYRGDMKFIKRSE